MARAVAALAVNGGILALGFIALLAVFQRPVFAATLVVCGWLLIALASSAKLRVLREPLVFADFGLFSQALRHPRLYLPYLGSWRAALAAAAAAAAVAAGLLIEDAVRVPLAASVALVVAAAASLAAGSRLARSRLTLEPRRDVARYGLLACLWLYWLAERREHPPVSAALASLALRKAARLVPIVVVQSESFIDARRLYDGIDARVLANFDALCGCAQSGRLAVPVWGAYTMRTEFAFLSGIAPERLGVHRFNPYRRYARRPVPTLASAARSLGYRTVCIHPYPASFFARDRVFPALGFDEFIDLAAFEPARRSGPYVADAEVTRRIISELGKDPVFVFAITMENHGPLHLEAVSADDSGLYRVAPPAGFDDLTVYLRHLRNADAMLGELATELARRGDGVLCWYGDHVPGMPGVYAAVGFEDSRTDYCVWRPGMPRQGRADLKVEALALRVLEAAGLAGAPG
jgi:hypothetical protein